MTGRQRFLTRLTVLLLSIAAIPTALQAGDSPGGKARPTLNLQTRRQVADPGAPGRFHTDFRSVQWEPKQTAIIVCDMWDTLYCAAAAARVGELAPAMNEVLTAARNRGVLIIHSPSNVTARYAGSPARKLAQLAPPYVPAVRFENWCYINPAKEGAMPIDDVDRPCESLPRPPWKKLYTREHEQPTIAEGDALSDNFEVLYLLKHRGIKNVIIMGVHTNMCVLGRPFGIRQLIQQGWNVVLMRDMTDSMCNSASAPFVSRFNGTEMIVEHIEKHWCPTIASVDFRKPEQITLPDPKRADATIAIHGEGPRPFRFKQDRRPHLVIVVSEDLYKIDESLTDFAPKYLGRDFKISFVRADSRDLNNLPALQLLDEADLALLSVRRRQLTADQMQIFKRFFASGKPIVALRSFTHAFGPKPGVEPMAGRSIWHEVDREIVGGVYDYHYPVPDPAKGPFNIISTVSWNQEHPILTDVVPMQWEVKSALYKYSGLMPGANTLLMGEVAKEKQNTRQPVAWLYKRPGGGELFYTSLGTVDDFKLPQFRRMLQNAVYWMSKKPIPSALPILANPEDFARDWHSMPVPGTWDEHTRGQLSNYDGFAWYSCNLQLPAREKIATNAKLHLAEICNCCEVYLNGTKIGTLGSFPPTYTDGRKSEATFDIPDALWKPASNVLAIRVYNHSKYGGFDGYAPQIILGNKTQTLAGRWDFRTGDNPRWVDWDKRGAEGQARFTLLQQNAQPGD